MIELILRRDRISINSHGQTIIFQCRIQQLLMRNFPIKSIYALLFGCLLPVVIFAQGNHADFNSARFLCSNTPLTIPELPNGGAVDESTPGNCFSGKFTETNALWLKFQVAEPGRLEFTILPFSEADDIDFVLYRLPEGLESATKEVVRCMAAGPNLGTETTFAHNCTGATGLRSGTSGDFSMSGCPGSQDNFLSPVEMATGETYALFINNFHSSGGIQVEWGGDCQFLSIPALCPKGTTGYEDISLEAHTPGAYKIFPNPTANRSSIIGYSASAQEGQLQVINLNGQLELTMPISLVAGENTLNLPAEDLSRGVHFIKIKTGTQSTILRLVKQ